MSYPLVSIIIPTYNYANYIHESIDSIVESDFPQSQVEILVIDDGSIDQTQEVVNRYDTNVKYVYQKRSGKAWATKVGIDLSRGKYIFNLDADDYFLNNKIRQVISIFENDSEIVHVAHPALIWNVSTNSKISESIPSCLLSRKLEGRKALLFCYYNKILFGGGSTFAARADTLKSLYIPKSVDMYIDEYLVLCALSQGYSYFIKEPLSVWRVHDRNYSDVQMNLSLSSQKVRSERSLNSMNAVLQCLNHGNFDCDLKKIYSLKVKVEALSLQEKNLTKTFSDIVSLWILFLQNFSVLSPNFWKLLKSYSLLNRSLPTPFIGFMRDVKKKFTFLLFSED